MWDIMCATIVLMEEDDLIEEWKVKVDLEICQTG